MPGFEQVTQVLFLENISEFRVPDDLDGTMAGKTELLSVLMPSPQRPGQLGSPGLGMAKVVDHGGFRAIFFHQVGSLVSLPAIRVSVLLSSPRHQVGLFLVLSLAGEELVVQLS